MKANQNQAEYWTSPAGLKWIEHEQALDTAMAGMLEMMLDEASVHAAERVIDIGCGTGASTIAAAKRVPNGAALGLDISEPLLSRARDRVEAESLQNATFLLADAQTHDLSVLGVDVLVSRIGMSFFSDTVAALRNLATALNADGRMAFVSWASVAQNPWFAIPKQAAEERLGPQPKGTPNAPGPTAFQDCDRVAELMKDAGLSDVEARPIEVMLTPPNGVAGAARAASKVGPAARIMKAFNGTEADALAIEEAVQNTFGQFQDETNARIPATVNLFTCKR